MDLHGIEKIFESTIMQKMNINGISFSIVPLDQAFPLIRDDIRNNKARNIARFSTKIYIKDISKSILSSLGLYKTVSHRIANDPGL